MSQTVRQAPGSRGRTEPGPSVQRPPERTVGEEPAVGQERTVGQEPAVQVGDALEWLWRFFISRRTGLGLILVLGVMSLIGTLLEQAPAEVRADPQAYAAWLDSVRPRYGGWTVVLDRLGFFGTFSAWWFRATLVLLTTSILACSVHRIPMLWRRAATPRSQPPDAFFERSGLRAEVPTALDPDVALAAAATALRRSRFRVVANPGTAPGHRSAPVLCADRFRWSPFGSIAAHLGFVVILLGAALSAGTGFKDPQFAAPVGSRVEVGHGTGLAVEALSFNDAYYDNGSPKDYASDLVVYRDGRQVARQTVRVNQPLTVDGISFYQSFFGTAASIKVTDAAQKVLADTAVPLLWGSNDGRHTIGQLVVPGQQLTVYLVMPASGEVDPTIQAGQVQLEIYRPGADTPVATQVISQGTPASIAGLTFTFERERQFTGLIVAQDPGVWLVWTGASLLMIGIFLVFFFPHRRLWVLARRGPDGGTTLHVAAKTKRDAAFEPQFRDVVDHLERGATAAPTDSPTPA